MMAVERSIRWTTAGADLGVAAVAAVASHDQACALVRVYGEAGWTTTDPADGGRTDLRQVDDDAAGLSA